MERSRGTEEEGKGGRVPPKGLDPLIFHVSNIVLHAVVSALVCWWVLKTYCPLISSVLPCWCKLPVLHAALTSPLPCIPQVVLLPLPQAG